MKIAIFNHTFDPDNGQANVNLQCAAALARRGHEITLVGDQPHPRSLVGDAVKWHRVSYQGVLPSNLLKIHAFAARCQPVLRQLRSQVDLIHANGAMVHQAVDVAACHFVHATWQRSAFHPRWAISRPRSVYQCLYSYDSARWERSTYRNATRVVAVSDFVRQGLIEDIGISSDKIDVINNGVDLVRFRPLETCEPNLLRQRLGCNPCHFLLFFAGDLKRTLKNFDVLLQALERLPDHIHIVAAGSYQSGPYPAIVKRKGLVHRVHMLGHCSELPGLYRGADAFALMSHYDASSLVVLEAMASGLPVITATSVGNSALLRDGVSGYVIDRSDDCNAVVKHIRVLASNQDLRRKMAAAARVDAEQHSWEQVAIRYEQVYRSVLDKKRRATGSTAA